MALNIRKGDLVQVISGKDRGVKGKVIEVYPDTERVIVRGGRDDRDVHAADAVDLVLVDLVEHRLLGEAERVVAVAVELARRQAPEVTDARQRN